MSIRDWAYSIGGALYHAILASIAFTLAVGILSLVLVWLAS